MIPLNSNKVTPNETVDHPTHYNNLGTECKKCGHPIECIDIAEKMGFNRGNAFKYLFRCYDKGNAVEDLKKAVWYINREIANIKQSQGK